MASQCGCAGQYFNYVTRTCPTELPNTWIGNTFLYDVEEYKSCDSNVYWDQHVLEDGYNPVSTDDKCSCVTSNRINADTDTDLAVGWTWDYTTETCSKGSLLYVPGANVTNRIDIQECTHDLIYEYPNVFSQCGSLNFCSCYIGYEAMIVAKGIFPSNNPPNGTAYNLKGPANVQCGWDFDQNMCVPQSDPFTGDIRQMSKNINAAYKVCLKLGYFVDQPREAVFKTEKYVYVSPTIAECAAKSDECTCNEDPRCVHDGTACYVHYDPAQMIDVELNRTDSVVNSTLVAGKCGENYCLTLEQPCECFETPYAGNKTCGWDGTSCHADLVTDLSLMYIEHCCDAFKTPCECKFGRLPWDGAASPSNTCGWDGDIGVCRVSAITSDDEIIASACDSSSSSCLLKNTQADCTAGCFWHDNRHTCTPGPQA